MKFMPPRNQYYNKTLRPFANKLRRDLTKAEACLWKFVLKGRVMKGYQFRRQRPVLHYVADFMCKELSLIIEVDGSSHGSDEALKKDQIRQRELEEYGFTVLRFSDEDVLHSLNDVIATIEDWINKRVS